MISTTSKFKSAVYERPSDRESLASFEKKVQVIRDRTGSVALNYHTAAYLVGRPGTSKTHTVMEELKRLDVPHVAQNGRMTPMGLFDCIAEHPEHVIVFDDIVSLFKSEPAIQILLAALDGEPGKPRLVKYKSRDRDEPVYFSGGIIAISNIPLRCDPLARALGSRIVMLEHEPEDEEIAAFMRHLALRGYKGLSGNQCSEVAEFIISESRDTDRRLDLRHLTKAFNDYRQCKQGHSRTAWRDLVRTSLQKGATEPLLALTKKQQIELDREKVRKAMRQFPDDLDRQMKAAGLNSRSTFYERRREVLAEAARASYK